MLTTPTTEPEEIFDENELLIKRVNPAWTLDQLLEQSGLFYFKDMHALLNISRQRPTQISRNLHEQNLNPWTTCGLRKVWTHWLVKMPLFAPYYNTLKIRHIKRVDTSWDGNFLITQQGVFLLAQVCKKIPFSTHQIRYRARKNPNAREEYGIWKEDDHFFVQMELFGPWIRSLWSQYEKLVPATKGPKKKAPTKAGSKRTVKT